MPQTDEGKEGPWDEVTVFQVGLEQTSGGVFGPLIRIGLGVTHVPVPQSLGSENSCTLSPPKALSGAALGNRAFLAF